MYAHYGCNQNQETCVYIKFPAVVGETTVQHIVQSVTCITGGALKIDHIEASVKEIDWDILDGKVVFHGVIHKQIFYVSKDNYVRHQSEDVQFSGHAEIPGAEPDMKAEVTATIRGPVTYQLLSRGRLEQHVLVDVTVRVTKTEELPVPLLGSVSGTVISNGAAQSLAVVAICDSMWRLIGFTYTNDSGNYRLVSLPPGKYYVVAARAGLYEVKEVTVEACKEANVNFFQSPSTDCAAAGIPSYLCSLLAGLLGIVTV
ncbi:MAG: Uncharacterized protein XD63_1399 [Thermoanaerobacterales bacterium 50_218]|nr:MAG: Uncharacterized protein XD63_1399 [Thermoanaerobacterales bacterium 50_218]HAA89761.1 hypothetical protein [Peptococcaceae bacterium]